MKIPMHARPFPVLTHQEEDTLFHFLKNNEKWKPYYLIFLLMSEANLRTAEVCGLCWPDIDFENNIIHVRHAIHYLTQTGDFEKGCCKLTSPKSGERIAFMTPLLKDTLLQTKQYQINSGISCDMELSGVSDFVVIDERERSFRHPRMIITALDEIIKDCNSETLQKAENKEDATILPHFRPYLLRHTNSRRYAEFVQEQIDAKHQE